MEAALQMALFGHNYAISMTNGEKGEAHQSTLQGQTRTSKMTAEGLA
jgi:hypothetical protein